MLELNLTSKRNHNTEVLYKPYSNDVHGYMIMLAFGDKDFMTKIFIINSNLSSEKQQETLQKLHNYSLLPQYKDYGFLLIQGNDELFVYKPYRYNEETGTYYTFTESDKIISIFNHKLINRKIKK